MKRQANLCREKRPFRGKVNIIKNIIDYNYTRPKVPLLLALHITATIYTRLNDTDLQLYVDILILRSFPNSPTSHAGLSVLHYSNRIRRSAQRTCSRHGNGRSGEVARSGLSDNNYICSSPLSKRLYPSTRLLLTLTIKLRSDGRAEASISPPQLLLWSVYRWFEGVQPGEGKAGLFGVPDRFGPAEYGRPRHRADETKSRSPMRFQ